MPESNGELELLIDAQSAVPAYRQLADQLADRIRSGRLPIDTRLPEERLLTARLGVSRGTIRKALQILEKQGIVRRLPSKGTFVCSPLSPAGVTGSSSILLIHAGIPVDMPVPLGRLQKAGWNSGYYESIEQGIQETARQVGLDVQIVGTQHYVRLTRDDYRVPDPTRVGGVILLRMFDEEFIRLYHESGVPCVVIDYWPRLLPCDCVAFDIESEAHRVVDHLARYGHTSLGFIAMGRQERGSDLREFDPDVWRLLTNLRHAAALRRVQMRDDWVLMIPSPKAAVEASLREFLSLRSRPTAILCFDDAVAAPLLHVLPQCSLRSPHDISIISRGADDPNGAPVTRMVSRPRDLGRMAIRLLFERMSRRRTSPAKLALPTELVPGPTTGPVPSA